MENGGAVGEGRGVGGGGGVGRKERLQEGRPSPHVCTVSLPVSVIVVHSPCVRADAQMPVELG